jgi:pimeloyl-ACP methyl ester carboxylesterase
MQLPIGYRTFHRTPFYNYQMNRLHALGFARAEDIERAAARIRSPQDYVREFRALAAEAKAEGRLKNAAFYLRAAEFFSPHTPEARNAIYAEFIEAFDAAFADAGITRHAAPYNGSFLPAMELKPVGRARGTVLLFGGFDSLIEEFFVIAQTIAEAGYRVIAFEGPGQGGALRLYGHTFDHDYEKPIGAVLDHFKIEAAALVGISMGGYWAVRAAAHEPRIKQLVAWPPLHDWMDQLPPFAERFVNWLLGFENFMNVTIRARMALVPVIGHAMAQTNYMMGGETPMDAVRWIRGMNRDHISSAKVTQDVLLLAGENDAFQPPRLMRKQQAALVNARSVTSRIFTKAEHAGMHCQMGNLNLALGVITGWLDGKAG